VIEFRVLGSFEVLEDERPVALGGPKQRALLVLLVLHRGDAVSTDRLVDELWGEQAPASAQKIVQGYVSHLRRALGDGLLVTRGRGYLLQTARGQVDLDRFDELVAEGRRALQAGDARLASDRLRGALALWRGPPLADFSYEPFAQGEIARLEEERLAALEDRIDADLALGEHAGLVSELDSLVHDHPLRERLQAQLMLALYRCGRQAEALERYQQARRELVDQLGIEPGRALRELEQSILEQDPALDPPARRTGAQPTIARRRSSRHSLSLLVGGGALLLAAAVAAATVTLTGGRAVTAVANSVAVINPQQNRVVGQISVGVGPDDIAVGAGGIWVANTQDHSISHINPASRTVVGTLSSIGTVDGVAADSGELWTVDSTRGVAARVDPTFETVLRPVGVGDQPGWGNSPNPLAVGGGVAWVANDASAVVRIAKGGANVSRIDVGNHPSGIAIGDGATWVADDWDGTVSRIDSTGSVSAVIPVGPGASGIAVGGGAVWVADTLADTLVRINPTTSSVTNTISVGSRPRGVAWGDGSVWVADSGDGTVSLVDPRTNRATTIAVGQSPQALVVTAGSVWVSVAARAAVPRSPSGTPPGVLRIAGEQPLSSTDPGLADNIVSNLQAFQMYYATCAGLLTYPDRPAPQGTRLVPDVARAMPTVSDDGRTYTFIVRPGFRFSSGAPVTAATFKHTIERTLSPKLKAAASNYMADIIGMPAYQARRTDHLAGVTASGDRLQIRLTAPAPDLPARIATLPFCAVPDDTPATAQHQPIPSAGPYYVVTSTPDQLVLARNPYYGGHRPRIPKRIVYSFNVGLQSAVKQVTAGQSDYLDAVAFPSSDQSPDALPLLQTLEQRYGPASAAARTGHQRYFVNPWLDLSYFVFNTARPLFASARLRRAVNYAIDRQALVQHHQLFYGGRATDHYLVPGIPGDRPLDIYPLGRSDLAKARQLANGVHKHAALYITTGEPQVNDEARIVQTDLKAIGITVDITALPSGIIYSRLATPGEPWDIAWVNWSADFADPFTMINELYDPSATYNFGRFNDPALTRRMRQAAKLTGERRLQAYARLDADLTRNDPPGVAWGIGTFRDFFSARVGCQIYQPIYGTDLGRLCFRQ
jgi:YVTN family beta-propeller protein